MRGSPKALAQVHQSLRVSLSFNIRAGVPCVHGFACDEEPKRRGDGRMDGGLWAGVWSLSDGRIWTARHGIDRAIKVPCDVRGGEAWADFAPQ